MFCHFVLTTTCGVKTIIILIVMIEAGLRTLKEVTVLEVPAQGHVPRERGGVNPNVFRYVGCHALPRIVSEEALDEASEIP